MSQPGKRVKIDLAAADHANSANYEALPVSNKKFFFARFTLPTSRALAIVPSPDDRVKAASLLTAFIGRITSQLIVAIDRLLELKSAMIFGLHPNAISTPARSALASGDARSVSRWLGWLLCVTVAAGCGTTNQRTGTEQMLMSDAVDMSISRIDFRPLAGRKAYLDTTYIRPAQIPGAPQNLVNADYVISGLRQALFAAHCELVDSKDEAEVIIEPRLGTLATNGHDVVYGVPQTNALAQASATLSGAPLLPPIPELSIGRSHSQFGLAKVAIFAYDKVSREPVWQSGIEKSESTAKNTWFVGAGPFQRGTIYQGYRFADSKFGRNQAASEPVQTVPFNQEHVFAPRPSTPLLAEEPPSPVNESGPLNPALRR
jgi:hypothetical protein